MVNKWETLKGTFFLKKIQAWRALVRWLRIANKSNKIGSHVAMDYVLRVLVVFNGPCCKFTFGLDLSTDATPNLKGTSICHRYQIEKKPVGPELLRRGMILALKGWLVLGQVVLSVHTSYHYRKFRCWLAPLYQEFLSLIILKKIIYKGNESILWEIITENYFMHLLHR